MIERRALEPEMDFEAGAQSLSSRVAGGALRPARRAAPAAGEAGKVVSLDGVRRASARRGSIPGPRAAQSEGSAGHPGGDADTYSAAVELVRRAEMLRRQELALERVTAVRSQFLAGMSHELRTPLNAILGYTSMLLQGLGGELTERQRGMLTRVDANSRSLLAVINDVLDISRLEVGRAPLAVSEIGLDEVVRGVLEELGTVIARSPVPVRIEVCPRLPTLRTDAAKVRQILLNLLSNALKFTEKGSVMMRASFDRAADQVAIAVADTGIGIPEAEHDRIFEDFHRVDDVTTRRRAGAGLGLAVCQRLASALGGRIALVSAPGRGATFTLVIPVDAPRER